LARGSLAQAGRVEDLTANVRATTFANSAFITARMRSV